ncbi:MAG: lipoprotein signal peptidase [Bacteroidaceae bacterium]|nr:lipoprotein signal peptidase [Bacteroidaceae bacterium]
MKHQGRLITFIVTAVVLIDQLIKVVIKTTMNLGEEINILSWFKIHFTENNGMAFGMEIFGKLFLTSFRVLAVILIIYYLTRIINKGFKTGYIICLSFILAGALGNIIDCLFYGVLFNESSFITTATFLPEGGGYAPFLYGKVVDMFYFPIIDTTWPNWVPFIGGESFRFFNAIFNFADASISCGIVALVLFYGKTLNHISLKGPSSPKETTNTHA